MLLAQRPQFPTVRGQGQVRCLFPESREDWLGLLGVCPRESAPGVLVWALSGTAKSRAAGISLLTSTCEVGRACPSLAEAGSQSTGGRAALSVWLASWNPVLHLGEGLLPGSLLPRGCVVMEALGTPALTESAPDTPGPRPGQAHGAEACPVAGESHQPLFGRLSLAEGPLPLISFGGGSGIHSALGLVCVSGSAGQGSEAQRGEAGLKHKPSPSLHEAAPCSQGAGFVELRGQAQGRAGTLASVSPVPEAHNSTNPHPPSSCPATAL